MWLRVFVLVALFGSIASCTRRSGYVVPDASGSGVDAEVAISVDASMRNDTFHAPVDAGPLSYDAACATSIATAPVTRRPVDIVWVIDNSASMQPAIAEVQSGLDAFATTIAGRDLDYRVIIVSKRGHGEYMAPFTSNPRYAVCVPPPLAGDADCHDGPRFFHESVDIRSTQPLEQLLGSLDETTDYAPGDDYGADLGETSWGMHLRPGATKTIVVVTDDNARMVTASFHKPSGGDADPSASPTATAEWFEHMPGGINPFNGSGATATRALPPGLLDPSRAGMFDGYRFDGIFGWGSGSDDTVTCTYGDGSMAASSGRTYSALVARTGGVRARICDGHSAWASFFDDVATAVVTTAHITCELDLPMPPDGSTLDPTRVNVLVEGRSGSTTLHETTGASACGTSNAWYYDDPHAPAQVVLCPAACDFAQSELATATDGVRVLFGCQSIII